MSTPRSVRFDDDVTHRLASFVARHPGLSASSVAARLVDEGLRMDEHPGVLFREGPMGRRATLVGGPDVWEVIRALRSARAAEPRLTESELFELVEQNTGVARRLLSTAVAYWGVYPEEVEAMLAHSERAEADGLRSSERVAGLLEG